MTDAYRFTLPELEAALALVRAHMPQTPAFAWPLLAARLGATVLVKHENHTPVGAFKIRGGLAHFDRLTRERENLPGVISATRGNHGQSLAYAGRVFGVKVTIVVPHGNSVEKNAAMRALGAELIEHGANFDEARAEAARLAQLRGLVFVPSFHPDLVRGVATYALEFFRQAGPLDVVYAPIGLGSGLCGLILTRDLLALPTQIVGVVAARADAYARSVQSGDVVTSTPATFADGMAVGQPSADALAIIRAGAARLVRVEEDEIAQAMRIYHEDTHNMAEPAGAAALAAALKERAALAGRRVGVVLSGANVDRAVAAQVFAGRTPAA
jgi:threonine dehydratase